MYLTGHFRQQARRPGIVANLATGKDFPSSATSRLMTRLSLFETQFLERFGRHDVTDELAQSVRRPIL